MVLMIHTRIPHSLSGTFGELLWRSFSACGVDTFVLISGYFGLKPSVKSWVHFLLPPTFYTLILCTINKEPFTHYQPWCSWWFVTCYLELLLIVPFINPIVNDNNKAANIRIIPEMTKEFEEIYSKSEPKCCSSRYNVLSWQGKFGNIYRFMMKLDMNNFVKLTLTS